MTEEKEIKRPNLIISDIDTMLLLIHRGMSFLQKGNSLLKAEGAYTNGPCWLWSDTTDSNGGVYCVNPDMNYEKGMRLNADFVLCPALSPSDTAKLKKKFPLKYRLLIMWDRLCDNDIDWTTEYECMAGEPVDQNVIQKSHSSPTGKTYPIFDQKERKIVQIPEIQIGDRTKYALFNQQYYPIMNAKGRFIINDDGQEIFMFSNVRMAAPMELDRDKKYTCLADSYAGKEVLPAMGLSLLKTEDWLRVKELKNSQHKGVANSAQKEVKSKWRGLFGLDMIVDDKKCNSR